MHASQTHDSMLWRSSSIEQWKSDGGEPDDALFEYLEDLSANDLDQLRGVVDLSEYLPLKPDPAQMNQPMSYLPSESVKQEDCATPKPNVLPEMKLTLFHKPRGSGGMWKPVAEGDAIRVTKDKGKKLRLRVECNFDFEWNELNISLVDLVSYTEVRQDFTFDLSKSTIKPTFAEIELNLIRICKKLQFAVLLQSKHGWTCNGRTITFIAHNNGKERVKVEPTSSHEPSPQTSPMPSPGTVTTPPQSVWPTLGANAVSEYLHDQAGSKKRKMDSPHPDSNNNSSVENITTIPGPLNVQGVVRATGFIQYSDLRLKTNVQDLVDALRLVQELQGKSYHWKSGGATVAGDPESGGKRVIGLIAQEVQKVVPEVVHQDPETGLLSVSYTELVPILIEALKQHLAGYSKDKEEFRKELDLLKEQMQSLAIGNSPATPDQPAQKTAPDWGSIIEGIKARTQNFQEPMTMEEVALVSQWAEECHIRLDHDVRRNIRLAKRIEKQKKKKEGQQRRDADGPGRKRDFHRRKDNQNSQQQFEQTLMLDPIKTQSAVLRFGTHMLKLASKRNSKLLVVLFWRKGFVDDLQLHLHREESPLTQFNVTKENKRQRRKIVGVTNAGSNESYHGTYKILVQIEGQGSTYHLQQSKAVVAVFDFRLAGSLPLWMMATSACGDVGKNWLVGSFVVDRSVLQWQTMPNTVLNKLPPDWGSCAQQGLSLSDPLPQHGSTGLGDSGKRSEDHRLGSPTQDLAQHQSKVGKGAPPPPRRVFLRSYHGAYLSASSDGRVYCSQPHPGGADEAPVPHFAETWDIEFDRHGAAFLRSFYGRYLSAEVSSSVVRITASCEFPNAGGCQTFFPLLDDRLHTLGLITYDGHYIHANDRLGLVGTPTLPSLTANTLDDATTTPVADSASFPLKSSVEFYRLMSEGCKAYLKNASGKSDNNSARDVLSSSFEFYQHLARGGSPNVKDAPTALSVEDVEVDMKGTFEFYKHLSDGALKGLEEADSTASSKSEPAPKNEDSLMNFHLPTEEEKWLLEVAPSREAQQAQMAQEVWQKTQHLRMIYSIHNGALDRKV